MPGGRLTNARVTPGAKEGAHGGTLGSPVLFAEVDITGNPELEARYREWLPVVEIDGTRAFVYYRDPRALQRKLAAQTSD